MVVRLMFNLSRFWPTSELPDDDDGPSLVGVKLSSSEWERRVARLEAHELDDGQSAIGEVYEAAPRPRWTREAPRDEGVWWVRAEGGRPRVVAVQREFGALRFSWTDVPSAPVHESGLEWSDRPILLPA